MAFAASIELPPPKPMINFAPNFFDRAIPSFISSDLASGEMLL